MTTRTGGLFCFGFGYTARALARLVKFRGWDITGTCRDSGARSNLKEDGYNAAIFNRDYTDPGINTRFARGDHILVSAPPDADGDPVLDSFADLIGGAADRLAWIGYLSTLGVYGDTGGEWVDENSPASPMTDRSRARARAEQQWLDLGRETGVAVHVFRLAGIYGPNRNQLEAVAAGQARRIVKPGQVFSRIHVADIAGVLLASIDKPRGGAIYNVCDDEPAPPQDVVAFAADLLGLPAPREVSMAEANLSPMAASFYSENRRVRNHLIKSELGYTLKYPSYRQGLRALLDLMD